MEHAKKMALVPQELLTTIQAKQQEEMSPLVKTTVSLDDDMKTILSRQDIPDDQKAVLYQQLLQRYLTYRDKRRTEPVSVRLLSSPTTTDTVPSTDGKTIDSSPTNVTRSVSSSEKDKAILGAFPKTMKSRARQILDTIKDKGGDVIGYDDQGQLLFNKQVVPGSNVSDLIRDTLQRRKGFNPIGWRSFARGLARINAPEAAIRHPTRLAMIQRHKSHAALGKDLPVGDESDEDDAPTPRPRRRGVLAQVLPAKKRKIMHPTSSTFVESSWK
ncbi:Hypp6074 [Branchiostoma lanceolatum]|uniref:Hypp6074 protein n=1 Tax=Branchiostoma lanceolatum TaxID=7740 RepID=A0A8J9YSC0_BRALA|nr:Hypp6074 [Branchiostoma lanceolatum]